VQTALRDPDPLARRAAASVIVQQGLSTVAGLLLESIRGERDPSVLDAIAEAVARNQWEPSNRPDVLEVRLWSARRLEERAQRRLEEQALLAKQERARLQLERETQHRLAEQAALAVRRTPAALAPGPPSSNGDSAAASTNGHGPSSAPGTWPNTAVAKLAAGAVRRLKESRRASGHGGWLERRR
jgi:hypothetical protein